MRILITGHKGFVGRHFVKYLKDHEIVGIDIKDGNDCRDFFKTDRSKFDLVIHLAAIVGGRQTIEGNPLSVATDLSIDAEMFNWALTTGQERVVYFSSSAAYPTELQTSAYRLKETDISLDAVKNPDMTYGWAKLTGEYLAHFAKQQGMKVYIFRPFSGYGEDQDLDYPFPSFIKRAREMADPFEIWGNGEQVRDFIHIDDIIKGVMKTVELDYQEPLNMGWGRPTSFNDLAKIILSIQGRTAELKHLPAKPVGVQYRCCDPTNFFKVYTPTISLEDGIKAAFTLS